MTGRIVEKWRPPSGVVVGTVLQDNSHAVNSRAKIDDDAAIAYAVNDDQVAGSVGRPGGGFLPVVWSRSC